MKKITYLLAIFFAALIACNSKKQPDDTNNAPSFPVTTLSSTDAEVYNEYPATIEGADELEIRPQVAGILEKVHVDEGAYVSKGQLLFSINDQPFRESVNNANAALLAAKAAAANAKLEMEKLVPLVDNKVMSPLQLKTAETNYQMTIAQAGQAQAVLADARIRLSYTSIKAPANGYIGRLNKKPGSLVNVNDAKELTTLSSIRTVRVYFSLSEKEFTVLKEELPGNTMPEKLKNAAPVSLLLAGGKDYPVKGTLDMVNGSFDPGSGAITLRASFPNETALLRSGNTGKIRLAFLQKSVIAVPQAATTAMQDKLFVFAVNDSSKVRKQLITVAGKSGASLLVRDGLKAGDRIVTDGIGNLQDGMLIKPASAASLAARD